MNILEALEYAQTHRDKLEELGQVIIGAAYTPDDLLADFQFIELSYQNDPDDMVDDAPVFNPNWYCATLDGGNLLEAPSIDDVYGNESREGLVEVLPDFASILSYQVHTTDGSVSGINSETVLKALFPILPEPALQDDPDLTMFKIEAINLITEMSVNK